MNHLSTSEALRIQKALEGIKKSFPRIEMSLDHLSMGASVALLTQQDQEQLRKISISVTQMSASAALLIQKAFEGINKSFPRIEMSLDHLPMGFHSKLIAPPQANPEPGNAAKVLNALNEEFQTKQDEHAKNPRKVVAMIATLSAGEKINVQRARNTGDETIEITGRNTHSGKKQKVLGRCI